MASAAHIADLPLELWREISSYLPNRDIKSMRLASKQLSVELRLGRVFLSPNPLNIKVFRAIADHDVFRHGVTEIIWDDAHLSRGPRIWTDFPGGESDVSDEETEESFLAKHRAGQDYAPNWGSEWNFRDSDSDSEPESDDEDADLRFEHDDDDLHLVPKSDNFKNQKCPLWFKEGCVYSVDRHFRRQGSGDSVKYSNPGVKTYRELGQMGRPLGECWEFYRNLVREQDDALAGKYDEEALVYGLRQFPSLKKVTVTPAAHGVLFRPLYQTPMIRQFPQGFYYPIPRGWPTPYRDQPEEPYCYPWQRLPEKNKEKYHGFRVVTRVLAHQKHNIVDLSIDARQLRTGINCTIFDDPCEEYENFTTILKQPGFRHLDLALAIHRIEEPEQNWRSLRNGKLHQALGQACDLEEISLYTGGIVAWGETREAAKYAPPVPLESIFPLEKWSKLRHFELSRFIVRQSDLLSCLSKLPDTLQSVKLSFLTFIDNGTVDNEWHPFLAEMRRQIREKRLWPNRQPSVTIGCMRVDVLPGRGRWFNKETDAFLYENGESPFFERPKGHAKWWLGKMKDSLDPHHIYPIY
ncbi:hypothetical protein N7494_001821 [Penicillium frequentans]|uniref:F-box domain-containing protein n=1 Tax=Penicillium frequentans TaxID=3151616 RepID=A0AAD6D4I1_9EURO|nr:hypothetical protein N7494_001821 [Penicillium glabrum]